MSSSDRRPRDRSRRREQLSRPERPAVVSEAPDETTATPAQPSTTGPRADSRARSHRDLPPTAPPREERVKHIAELMAGDQWERGKSGRALARQWGLSYSTLREDAARASVLVHQVIDDERLLAECDRRLDAISELARRDKQYGAAVQALRLRLEAHGVLRQRHDHTHRYEQMSDEELAREVSRYLQPRDGDAQGA